MAEPFFILCPGRSFSSVACGMLGEHPQMYGVPELNIFLKDTVRQLLSAAGQLSAPSSRQGGLKGQLNGLLRVLAQLHEGEQTEASVDQALQWLRERERWSSARLFYYLQSKIHPKICVDKSLPYGTRRANLARLHAAFPRARYLHLSRHPRPTCNSMFQVFSGKLTLGQTRTTNADPRRVELNWLQAHQNITLFTRQLPLGQSMFLQGEDLLAEPDRYLRQIVEWLGLRDDEEAIEAMKHPENSPYASFGPPNARAGNNFGFLENPRMRVGRPPEASLEGPLEWVPEEEVHFSREIIDLAHQMGYR